MVVELAEGDGGFVEIRSELRRQRELQPGERCRDG